MPQTFNVTDEPSFRTAMNSALPNDATTINVMNNFAITQAAPPAANTNVLLQSGGGGSNTIDFQPAVDPTNFFPFYAGTTFALQNITLDGQNNPIGALLSIGNPNTTLTLGPGSVIQNFPADNIGGTIIEIYGSATNTTVNITGGQIINNKNGQGVGVWIANGATGALNMTDGKIDNNSSELTQPAADVPTASAVYIGSPLFPFNMSGGEINNNDLYGVTLDNGGQMNMTGGTISGNIYSGVFITTSHGVLNFNAGTISGNKNGGIKTNGTVNAVGACRTAPADCTTEAYTGADCGVISTNTAPNGAGIYGYGGSVINLQYTGIYENTAASNGGGIYLEPASSLTMANAQVMKNGASSGGGIYADSAGTLSLSTSCITQNTASDTGGGMALFGSTAGTLASTTLADNSARDGGGYYVGA